ncbi:hypothetical protein PM082_021696 [Marasmius tenuissimus]|nr:hypothetical protein PM082_021696 [Marasmius tenuissimus]
MPVQKGNARHSHLPAHSLRDHHQTTTPAEQIVWFRYARSGTPHRRHVNEVEYKLWFAVPRPGVIFWCVY